MNLSGLGNSAVAAGGALTSTVNCDACSGPTEVIGLSGPFSGPIVLHPWRLAGWSNLEVAGCCVGTQALDLGDQLSSKE